MTPASKICQGCGKSYTHAQKWWHEKCAINAAAINESAINKEKEDVIEPADSAGKESGAGLRTANRRDRAVYNEYMRRKMREYRALKKGAQKAS